MAMEPTPEHAYRGPHKFRPLWLCLVHLETQRTRVAPLLAVAPGIWTIGRPGSGAVLELDEPVLAGCRAFVWAHSNDLALDVEPCTAEALGEFGLSPAGPRGQWQWQPLDAMHLSPAGRLSVRFDRGWVRIGGHAFCLSLDRATFDVPRPETSVQQRPARGWWRRLFGG